MVLHRVVLSCVGDEMPAKKRQEVAPWNEGDPEKKIAMNVPFPEPLMLQMDWMIENRVIRSKSSFIRDAVAEVAQRETERALKIQEAVRRMDAGKS